MERVLVVGTTGAGKTTLASALAKHLDVPHVELDSLFWKPDWVEAGREEFLSDVLAATAGPRWVVCGNYRGRLGDALWERADTVVWLDLRLPILVRRVASRTIKRSVLRTELWSGNRERLSGLWRPDSIMRWVLASHKRNRARYAAASEDPRWAAITIHRLRSPRAVRGWLRATVG